MTNVEKFRADVARSLKHVRADNNGRYDSQKAVKDVVALFLRASSLQGSLASSLAEYWQKTYIDESQNPNDEPTEENINRLCAIFSFLENSHEYEESLNDDDWRMISELVNYEAEDLPIETLQSLMETIVEKGVI